MRLYYAPKTRAFQPRWLLEELAVAHELVRINVKEGEHKSAAYLKINPQGGVPTLVDNATVLYEVAAMLCYLADKHMDKKLAPGLTSPERGLYFEWLFYGLARVEPTIRQISYQRSRQFEANRTSAAIDYAVARYREALKPVEVLLEKRDFVLDKTFSAADVALGGTLLWAYQLKLLNDSPKLVEYVERCQARPAFAKANAD
jgi:glutathione S-transferase